MSTGDTVSAGRLATTRPSWQTAFVVIGWSLTVLSLVGMWILLSLAEPGGDLASTSSVLGGGASLGILTMVTFGAVVVLRGEDPPRYGLIMLAAGAISAFLAVNGFYGLYSLEADVLWADLAIWTQDLWMAEMMFFVLLLPALVPDGTVAAPGWRRAFRIVMTSWIVLMVVFVFAERPATNFFEEVGGPVPANPTGFLPIPKTALDVSWVTVGLASVVVGFGSLITRWRRAEGEMRQRLKWLLFALAILVFAVFMRLLEALLGETGVDLTPIADLVFSVAAVAVTVGIGLAVLKFRLYDVDLVINRTIVYGLLTVIVIAIYVGVVVGVGALLPVEESALALVTTGVVAVGFAPVRSLVQGGVNRLMFGQRDDPYAVLTKMGRLLASSGTPEETLQSLVETIAVSLKLPGSAIELEEEGDFVEWARHGELGSTFEAIPLEHQDETVGRLLVATRSPREPLSSQDVALLESVAHQAGALVRSVRLTVALQRSRERLVLAQEEERRRIRHDLHDELGPSLASQTFQLDAILERIENDPGRAKPMLQALKEQNKQLVADIRRLVYELRPPALDELGVAGALSIQASQFERAGHLAIELETRPEPLPELPAAVEVAAYRIAREAIINSVRHAEARECKAILEATDSELIVTVSDDGVGIDRDRRPGVGLTSMRERTEELGGTFQVKRIDPRGTRIRAALPLINGSDPAEAVKTNA